MALRKRNKSAKNVKKKTGQSPGSLIYTGVQHLDKVHIEYIEYNEVDLVQRDHVSLEDLEACRNSDKISWINITGLHDTELIGKVGEIFGLHTLLLEDILNVNHRPGYHEDEQVVGAFVKMLTPDPGDPFSQTEQVAILAGSGFVLTFQEYPGDVFGSVRERLLRPTTRIRSRKADYLAYALLDAVVDQYLVVIDELGVRVEDLEDSMMQVFRKSLLDDIYMYKSDINFLRKIIRPVREIALQLEKSEAEFVEDSTGPYLKDLVDHAEYAAESVETFRETINDLLNFYHTQSANRLNDILKILTIFSVVFIPLSFLTGLYGTNFEFIPEIHREHAWPVFLGAEAVIAIVMILFFKSRKWL